MSSPKSPKPAKAPKPPKAPGRWRRRLLRLLALLLLLRLVLGLALPSIVAAAAEAQGFEARYEDLDLTLLSIDLELRHLELIPIGEEDPWLHVEYVRADVAVLALLRGELIVRRVELDGMDVELRRTADGQLLPLGASPKDPDALAASSEAEPESTEDEPAASDAPAEAPSLASPVVLDALRLQHVRVGLLDETRDPPVRHHLELNVRLSDLGSETRPTRLSLELGSPSLVHTLRLDGSAQLQPELAVGELRMQLAGLAYAPWEPELAAAGWRSDLHDGRLGASFVTRFEAQRQPDGLSVQAQLTDLVLRAAGHPATLTLPSVGAQLQIPIDGPLRLIDGELSGLRAEARLNDDGSLGLLGLIRQPAPPSDDEDEDDEPETPAGPPARMLLDRFRIEDVAVSLERAGRDPLALLLHALELNEVDTLAPADTDPGRLDGALNIPGLLESIALSGELNLREDDKRIDLRFDGTQLAPTRLDQELQAAGLPTDIASAGFSSHFQIALSDAGLDGLSGIIQLEPLSWQHEERTVELPLRLRFGLAEMRAPQAEGGWPQIAEAQFDIGVPGLLDQLLIEGSVKHDGGDDRAEALVHLNGLDLGGAWPWLPEGSPLILLDDVMARMNLHAEHDAATDAPLDLALDGALHLTSQSPPRASWELGLKQLAHVDPDTPTQLDMALRIPGDLEELTLSGSVWPRSEPRAELTLAGSGLTLKTIGPLLPPGVVPVMNDGRLGGKLLADVQLAADGGQNLEIALTDFDYREAGAELPWFAAERVAVLAPRIDMLGGAVDIDAVELLGMRGHAQQTPDGDMLAAGFRLSPPPPVPNAAEPAPSDASVATTTKPVVATTATAPPAPLLLNHLDVGRLAVELTEFSVAIPEHDPVALRDFSLRSTSPLAVDFDDDETGEIWPLEVRGQFDPLGAQLAVDIKLQPFMAEPGAEIDVMLAEVSGAKLMAWRPALAEQVDASALEHGELRMHISSRMEGPRKSALDFALGEGRKADVTISKLAWRAEPGGDVLAGVDAINLRVAGGQARSTRRDIESVSITMPRLHAEMREDGLHALGVRVPPAPPSAEPVAVAKEPAQTPPPTSAAEAKPAPTSGTEASPTTTAPTTPTTPAASASTTAPPKLPAEPSILIRELLVSGIDVSYVDHTSTPPFYFPLDRLDVDVRNLVLGPGSEKRQLAATLLMGVGPVPNPDDPDGPQQALMQDLEVHVSGTTKSRQVHVSLIGLNLGAMEGAAASGGVELEGGELDLALDAYRPAVGPMVIKTRARFVDLDLSEGKNGPISSYLKLPAPLDAVLAVLRDESGVIDIPINLEIPQEGLSTTKVASLAISTLGGLITDALRSAPLRVVGGVGSMVGFDISKQRVELPPIELDFQPGSLALRPAAAARLPSVIEALREHTELVVRIEHQPGQQDIKALSTTWIPDEALCRQLLEGLAREYNTLLAARPKHLNAARAALVAGANGPGRVAIDSLRNHDEELGELHARMDDLLGMMGRQRAREQERRESDGILLLGEERLARVRSQLLELAPDLVDRLRLRRPRRSTELLEAHGELQMSYRREVGL